MVSIRLSNCKYCFSLPPLGHLPVLKRLYVEGFYVVSHVGREFYRDDSSSAIKPFKSLEVLSFKDMPEWQEWFLFEGEDEGGIFSTLLELCIIKCPKLSKGLPDQLPSLTKLQIEECQQLVASVPKAPNLSTLQLSDCDKVMLKELSPRLCQLKLRGCHVLQSFVELMTSLPGGGLPITLKFLDMDVTFQLPNGHYYPSLKKLMIRDGCDSLWSFPLEFYPNLKSLYVSASENLESLSVSEGSHLGLTSLTLLYIWNCPNFISFPSGGLCGPNLTIIWVNNCGMLKSLPEQMCTLLPPLVSLGLTDCPELESFPEGGLPLKLVTLYISNCEKLFSRRMEWGLQGLHSLREFKILGDCEELESFPEEALLPPTLTDFTIKLVPNLKSLNGTGFQYLTSLRRLEIWGCKNLQYLPKDGFPTSLSSLILHFCSPLLEQRCQREKGEDWPSYRLTGKSSLER